jgi:5-methyltetrahydrofolate--homocysteine methyltransferase
VESARNITELAVARYGLDPHDIFIDTLALPLSTGMVDSRRDGIETIDAIRRIKDELPGVRTILGLSNISFGLNPAARQVLNSVFLHECADAGLDAAIVHASKLLPLNRVDEEARRVCLDLIYDRRSDGYDPLTVLLGLFEGVSTSNSDTSSLDDLPLNDRLRRRIIDGARVGLEDDLAAAMAGGTPVEKCNSPSCCKVPKR